MATGSNDTYVATIRPEEKKSLPKHWERFQLLKARREKVSKKTSKQMVKRMTRSAIETVRREVSVDDVKEILQSEGIDVTTVAKPDAIHTSKSESQWEEIKKFLDPNPHLTSVADHSVSTVGLERRMNEALESGKIDQAVEMSDKISKVEFASRVATAIDCHKYVQKKQLEEAKRRKKPRLKWRYEHKQRWETKSNM